MTKNKERIIEKILQLQKDREFMKQIRLFIHETTK
jgi:hypothetical protein